MSTEYYTEPGIEYEQFLAAESVEVRDSPKTVYLLPHKLVWCGGSFVFARKGDDGNVRFERCGRNDISNVFPHIIEEFQVKIFDEFGLEYPDCIT